MLGIRIELGCLVPWIRYISTGNPLKENKKRTDKEEEGLGLSAVHLIAGGDLRPEPPALSLTLSTYR
jgi:hypothetical protein